ncbi:hypothetical protein PIROE2DRAFT_12953 [Piromyces sp. E2]|nr:hypothetical protein PIROE2DRAFT_12953 [Piromyces sp. E2]|eukprot:OUM61117.1 hypothetical protein PIROE2DRAFT_12953 [Piromyces sp. E2]
MSFKYLIILFFVTKILAVTPFIKKGFRAELFELMDNEVPTIRVTIPDDKFVELKEKSNIYSLPPNFFKMDTLIQYVYQLDLMMIEQFQEINYKNQFPGINANELLPELNIDENGYSHINVTDILQGINLTKVNILQYDFSNYSIENFLEYVIDFNTKFNFTHVVTNIDKLFSTYADTTSSQNETKEKDEFKTKKASMTVEINNEIKKFDKLTFKLGGNSARRFGKQGFNINIRGGDKLYGRSQFKLRADPSEATYLRSKLICDIHNRLGLPSISANYVTLYINEEYMGLYILMDAIKPSWTGYVFDDENTTTLYQCKKRDSKLTLQSSYNNCKNENEDVKDNKEWYNFLLALDNANSVTDIENILDIDQFLTEMAIEYLTGAFDHYLNFGHNFYMYLPKNDTKWKFLSYDFDFDLGQDIDLSKIGILIVDLPEQLNNINMDYPNYSFEEWAKPNHLIDILILKDPHRFEEILKDIVTKVFNPAILFPHIDELKAFIKPYVEMDKILNNDGYLPGKLNRNPSNDYTLVHWDANSEFTTIETTLGFRAYGLKYWILAKYRYICKAYGLTCDATYMDENFQYPIDKSVEAAGYDYYIEAEQTEQNPNDGKDFIEKK